MNQALRDKAFETLEKATDEIDQIGNEAKQYDPELFDIVKHILTDIKDGMEKIERLNE